MENTKRDMTRRTIMRAARVVYEEKGIENASFSDIAERAGVSRSTVFNYFAGTQEMLTALCGKEIADLEAAYEAGGHRGKEGIISIFETLVEDTAKFPKLVTSIIYSALVSGSEDNPLKMIEELLARNLEDDEDGINYMLLMGAYYGLVNHYHMSNLPFEGEKMKEKMREMIDAVI